MQKGMHTIDRKSQMVLRNEPKTKRGKARKNNQVEYKGHRITHCKKKEKSIINPKEFYIYIRPMKVLLSTTRPLIDEKGDFATDGKRVISILTTFLASVHTSKKFNNIIIAQSIQTHNK